MNVIKKAPQPELLTAVASGYFAGTLLHNGEPHALIVAPKESGEFESAAWHEGDTDISGALNYVDGRSNTEAMAKAGSELATTILALNIGGHTDWALPARDQLELIYRNAKPSAYTNTCSFRDGDNPSSVPAGYPYTDKLPAQTTNSAFQTGGDEALQERWYWSSTQYSVDSAWIQYFFNGGQDFNDKEYDARARAVRMIPLSDLVI